ncbi:hypothetical protein HYPSUDRAFT_78610 [Hypholoma sublateritium FD-334 SS-4]|uniref:Uncharacterized protein n=1 Tax=Hypholoma sublateritium (strain FD-334 SS-4) TaxID=945553 RepID=A0A0D2NLP1_HYPSF|nr:hypothetical protein HYPSUDRAFT_78610 [Hypholoma sublateritium FD-334 SS-4]
MYLPFKNTSRSAFRLVDKPLAHTNHPWVSSSISSTNSPITPFPAVGTSGEIFAGRPFFPEENHGAPFRQPATRITSSGSSQSPVPLQGIALGAAVPLGSVPNHPSIPYNALTVATESSSRISPLHNPLSACIHASGTSSLSNALGDYRFSSGQRVINGTGTYSAPVLDSSHVSQAVTAAVVAPDLAQEPPRNTGNPGKLTDSSAGTSS